MRGMVLAAGKGTRLLPLTGELPKPMAPIVGKPMIQHIFELLAGSGVKEVHVNVFHLAESILDCYEESSRVNGMSVNVSREEQLMGTAGGVKRLVDRFDGMFVVVMGDALTDVDVREVVAFHKEREALATLALMPVSDTSGYGVVRVDGEGNILAFQEKPDPAEAASSLANTGIYVLEPEALRYIPKGTFFDFAYDLFPRPLEAGERFVGCEGNFYWSDVGTLGAYRTAQSNRPSGKVRVKIPRGATEGEPPGRRGRLVPSDGRYRGAGSAQLGRRDRAGTTLTGDVTVGSGCWVRPRATIKSSILLPGSYIGDGAYLEGCIVGSGYHVRSGERIRGGALSRGTCQTKTLIPDANTPRRAGSVPEGEGGSAGRLRTFAA